MRGRPQMAPKKRGRSTGMPVARRQASPLPVRPPDPKESERTKRALEAAIRERTKGPYLLRLYVTGMTAASSRAIERAREICDKRLQGLYQLEVIDLYQLPALAKDHQIVATPTLIKVLPAPLRRYIGDLSRSEKVLFGLDIREPG